MLKYKFKKKNFSILIIIISTTISVSAMLLPFGVGNNKKIDIDNNNGKIIVKNEIIKDNSQIDTKATSSNNDLKADKVEQVNIVDNPKNTVNVKEESKSSDSKNSVGGISTPIGDRSTDEISSQEEIKSQVDINELPKETVPVFKVNKNSILKDLSFFDKEKLILIASKLSKSDYNKIVGFLENDVNGQGVVKSLKLSKEKLSKKDYSKLRGIAEKYINMDAVENN